MRETQAEGIRAVLSEARILARELDDEQGNDDDFVTSRLNEALGALEGKDVLPEVEQWAEVRIRVGSSPKLVDRLKSLREDARKLSAWIEGSLP